MFRLAASVCYSANFSWHGIFAGNVRPVRTSIKPGSMFAICTRPASVARLQMPAQARSAGEIP